MKTITYTIIIFAIGQLLITTGLDMALARSGFRYSKLYYGRPTAKCLIVGNSRGLNSVYVPDLIEKTGREFMNLSFNGLRPEMACALVRDYAELQHKPDLVLFEISTMLYDKQRFVTNYGMNYEFNLYSAQSGRISKVIGETNNVYDYINPPFPLHKYNSKFLYRSLFYFGKANDNDWIARHTITPEMISQTKTEEEFDMIIRGEDIERLARFAWDMSANGIEVIYYLSPYYKPYLAKIRNMKSALHRMETECNINIYDISEAIDNTEYFSDRIHTNRQGAMVCNSLLLKYIVPDIK